MVNGNLRVKGNTTTLPRGLSLRGRGRMKHRGCRGSKKSHSAGVLRGFTAGTLVLLGGVTGERGELELTGTYGVNPSEDRVVVDLVVTKVAAKAVRA